MKTKLVIVVLLILSYRWLWSANTIEYYQSILDETYIENVEYLDTLFADPNYGVIDRYYYMQYILMGTISMYEATDEIEYLDRALKWSEIMISKATVKDSNGNLNWPGEWKSPYSEIPIYAQLWDLQGSTELARLARIILMDHNLEDYHNRGQVVYEFVKEHIVEKWGWTRKNVPYWYIEDAESIDDQLNDKTMLFMRNMLDIYLIDSTQKYDELLVRLANGMKQHIETYDERSLIFDKDLLNWDVSHANRFPILIRDMYEAGIVFDFDDVLGFSYLLTDVIWNGSIEDAEVSAYINGDDGSIIYKNIYAGWNTLGEYNSLAQEACHAVFMNRINEKHIYRNTAMAGNLARNLKNYTTYIESIFNAHDIVIFPNPSSFNIYISSEDLKASEFYIFSILGEKIISGTIYQNNFRIDISKFPTGIYILRIGNKGFKIIKK